jgi:1,4-alpha-glucan branching enzyme
MTKTSAKPQPRPFDAAIEALVSGRHGDPFGLLGPHPRERGPGVMVRALQPAARELTLRLRHPTTRDVPMTRVHPDGVFEATLDDVQPGAIDYRFVMQFGSGVTIERGDPYNYGQIITDFDLHLFGEGTHLNAYDKLGAHAVAIGQARGVHFAVWAPAAQRVSVIGDFNGWDGRVHVLRNLIPSGIWEIFVPDLEPGERYKFEVRTRDGRLLEKADPFAFASEVPPRTASVVHHGQPYRWNDDDWMARRSEFGSWFERPFAVYEVHLGSWRRHTGGADPAFLSYRELAEQLVPYVKEMGFTHIELLPVMEHPFLGSWGYQVSGFYAPSSRFGPPEEFKAFVDICHQNGIGVLLDWVPGHFPKDPHGLARFDGTAAYEHEDPRQGEHQDWGTLIFNYGRNEVRNFLLSNALFWLREFHVDGLRVDAVASMLYLDYSRQPGEWVPNRYGGRENLEAVEFVRQLNALTHEHAPGSITAAEESTAWPAVSRPVYVGGLGFTYKWNMGWMHDVLQYMSRDPVHRRWAHNEITFSMLYAYTENFVLPFSHDEVVHGKRSLLDKMPGDGWQKAANLRMVYAFMYGHPGKKLLFMGSEFGQWREWNHDAGLDWHLLEYDFHRGIQRCVRDLNALYAREPALYERDFDPSGFQWIDCSDHENSVVSLLRRATNPDDHLVMVLNFTPVPRSRYRIGVPSPALYREVLNTDSALYGGSDVGNGGAARPEQEPAHGFDQSLCLELPPLGCVILKPDRASLE